LGGDFSFLSFFAYFLSLFSLSDANEGRRTESEVSIEDMIVSEGLKDP